MPKPKQWTDEDRARALEWIEHKAKTAAIFKGQDVAADDLLQNLRDTDLDAFTDAVRDSLTADAWRRLLNALRQRKHKAQEAAPESKSEPEPEPMPARDPRTYNTWRIALKEGRIKPIEALMRWTYVAMASRVMDLKEYTRLVIKTLPDVEWHKPGEKLEVMGYMPVTWTCARDFYQWADSYLGDVFTLGAELRKHVEAEAPEQRARKPKTPDAGTSEISSEVVPVPKLGKAADKQIRDFAHGVNDLTEKLVKILRSGAILKMREDARAACQRSGMDRTSLRPYSAIHLYPMGHALRIEARELATFEEKVNDDSGIVREGVVLMTITLEPVRQHYDHGDGAYTNMRLTPDTWANAAKYMTLNPDDYVVRVG